MSRRRHHLCMSRATKAERRSRRRGGRTRLENGWRFEGLFPSEQPLGLGVVSATPAEVFAAFEKLPPELPWPAVAPRLVPMFDRVRPFPPGTPKLAQAIVPPGLPIGFGIDLGPGIITVSPHLIDGWAVSVGDVTAQALANLHAIAAEVDPADVFRAPLADVEAGYLQTGRGIGSTLVLAPTELARIFGAVPRLFIAPMRDLIVGFPHDVDRELVAWLYDEIASGDPNCLVPRAFAFDGRQVTVERLDLGAAVA
jgi:hypothetical protein